MAARRDGTLVMLRKDTRGEGAAPLDQAWWLITCYMVQTAFLNATLEFEVYIKLPKGFHIGGFQYGRAVKSIYGLKQAARDWHRLQEKFILQFDRRLSRSPIDPCMFFISTEGLLALVVTYVDDYFIASSDPTWTEKFINAFKKRFTVTVLGEPSTVLQMGVTWSRNSVSISQKRFILDLADAHGLRDCAPMQTPMEKDIELHPAKECDLNVPFRSLIGALLWALVSTIILGVPDEESSPSPPPAAAAATSSDTPAGACEALLVRVLEMGTTDNQTACAALLGPAGGQSV